MLDIKIATLYKNNGDRSNCSNYRGISHLSIVGKLNARIILVRLQNWPSAAIQSPSVASGQNVLLLT